MTANEFVKNFGWDIAKLNVSSCSHQYYFTHNGHDICVEDLKRLVESYELVQEYGGLDKIKSIVNGKDPFELTAMQGYFVKAIADVESCIGEQNEI